MTDPAPIPYDIVVLTAANRAQARGYEAQLRWRRAEGRLTPGTRYLVVPDPGGCRVGALGATVNALARLALESPCVAGGPASVFRGRRILICHSGGDSRRLPAYAAQGKVFLPLPVSDRSGSLAFFDLILANAVKLPAPAGGQGHVVILAGDVLLTLEHAALDFSAPGVTGVATPASFDRGARHGVYVVGASETAGRPHPTPVLDFLQKPDLAAARAHGALDAAGRVLVDTGILSLDPDTAGRLLTWAGLRRRRGDWALGPGLLADLARGTCPPLNLYEELTMALLPRLGPAGYVARLEARAPGPAHRCRLRGLYRALRGVAFTVNIQPACEFFHIGTSRELLANMSLLTRTARMYGFRNFTGVQAAHPGALEGAFVLDTLIDAVPVKAGLGVFVEGCRIASALTCAGDNVLVGLPPQAPSLALRRGVGLVCLPIGRTRWAAVVFGMEDDFKGEDSGRGGGGCRFLNEPIERWLDAHAVPAAALWGPGVPRSLWHARLWQAGSLAAVLEAARWIQAPSGPPGAAWRRGPRLAMADLLRLVHHGRLIEGRRDIRRRVELCQLRERLAADDALSAEAVVARIRDPAEAESALAQAVSAGAAPGAAPLFRARALELARRIAAAHALPDAVLRRHGFPGAESLSQAVLDRVSDALAPASDSAPPACPAVIQQDQVVWVTTPVRLDFAGGWSDTPPYCLERGGTVLNAAITLNGQYPVQVMAKLNNDRCIRLASIDLGSRRELRTAADVLDHDDPRDWAALPKAALVLTGIAPARPDQSLARRLDQLGGGLDLTLFSAVPKGSGLGTSSILGAAVLACLRRIRGEPAGADRLTALTSVLEQRMRTGGGWQDQVGGIVPGVKLIRTQPGPEQTPSLHWIVFNMARGGVFDGRLLLYFTGQKRMARDILHNVVRRYLARDPGILRILEEIKALPARMKEALDAQQPDAFARLLDRYWDLKKQMDAGSTNPCIEALLRAVQPWTLGRCLAGAGGGGFVLFVARDPKAALVIRRRLEAHPPHPQARFFEFAVDSKGLDITVL